MASKRISELDALTELSAGFFIPVDNAGEGTKKIELSALLGLVYPVGSVYQTLCGNDPGLAFGGTWEKLDQPAESAVSSWARIS